MRRAIPLLTMMLLVTASCAKRPEPPASEEVELDEIVYMSPENYEYVHCDQHEADLILLVEIFVRDGGAPSRHRFPLKFNPNGKIRGVGSTGHHWCGCGGGGGENGSVSFRGHDEQQFHLTADVSYSWSSAAGKRGEGEGEVAVPWMGTARRAIGGGITVRVSFVVRV